MRFRRNQPDPEPEKNDGLDGLQIPDYVPDDLVKAARGELPEMGEYEKFRTMGGVSIEQTIEEAVHRLRESGGCFVLLTPYEDEHGGRVAIQSSVTGSYDRRVTLYSGFISALAAIQGRLVMTAMREKSLNEVGLMPRPEDWEDEEEAA